jgi:hypothetical protein
MANADSDRSAEELGSRARRFSRFLTAMVLLDMIGIVAGATLAPPDPTTQLYWMIPTLILAPLGAYWLIYRGGYERLRRRGG